jgi:hypothetical protein
MDVIAMCLSIAASRVDNGKVTVKKSVPYASHITDMNEITLYLFNELAYKSDKCLFLVTFVILQNF